MSAFEAAWSIVKANPNFQAYKRLRTGHPDYESNVPDSRYRRTARNLGTVDPAALIYALRAQHLFPEQARSMLDLGSSSPGYETGHTPFIDLDSEYMGEHDEEDGGFQTKYGQKGSVTRMPRPHAYTQYPEEGTPQRLIDEMQD